MDFSDGTRREKMRPPRAFARTDALRKGWATRHDETDVLNEGKHEIRERRAAWQPGMRKDQFLVDFARWEHKHAHQIYGRVW